MEYCDSWNTEVGDLVHIKYHSLWLPAFVKWVGLRKVEVHVQSIGGPLAGKTVLRRWIRVRKARIPEYDEDADWATYLHSTETFGTKPRRYKQPVENWD